MVLSHEERRRIVRLHFDEGLSKAQIERLTGHKFETIDHWIKHWEEHGDVEDEVHPGPTPVVSTSDRVWIKSKALRSGWDAHKITVELKLQRRVSISDRRVQQILNEEEARNRATRKKHPLTAQEKEKRLAWAQQNKDRSWKRVLFSDYFKLEVGSRKKRRWVKRGKIAVEEKRVHPQRLTAGWR